MGTRCTWRLSTYSPWRVVTESERLGSRIFDATSQLLYCHNPWVGVCQHTRGAMTINPTFVGEVQRIIHTLTRHIVRTPSSGMLGVGLALALCNRTVLFGSTLVRDSHSGGAAPTCAKYFDWDEFSQLSTPLRTLAIKQRNLSVTGGKVCVTTREYFNDASHSWYWEREAMRALAEAGAIESIIR